MKGPCRIPVECHVPRYVERAARAKSYGPRGCTRTAALGGEQTFCGRFEHTVPSPYPLRYTSHSLVLRHRATHAASPLCCGQEGGHAVVIPNSIEREINGVPGEAWHQESECKVVVASQSATGLHGLAMDVTAGRSWMLARRKALVCINSARIHTSGKRLVPPPDDFG